MAVVSLCLVLYVSTQPRPLFLWAFIFNLRFRPFSIRRGRPFALSVFAPSCLCSLNTSGGGVHIVHVVYIRAGCLDAAPLGGAGGCFRAFVFCCTKRARACDNVKRKGERCTRGKRTARGRSLPLHTAGRLSTLSILGAGCFSCSCLYSLNAAAVGVHIVHVVYIRAAFGRCAPAAALRLLGRSLFVGRGRLFSYRIASMRGAAISGGVWALHPLGVLC